MASVEKFEDLEAWQRARNDRAAFDHLHGLAVEVSGKLGGLMAYLKASGMKGSKYKVDEPGTRNPEPGTRQAGFSIVTAVFLVVVLALLGAFIVSVTGLQQTSAQLDLQGVRAYQAARAGIDWGAWQVLDPNNNLPGFGGTETPPPCPGGGASSTTSISTLAGTLSTFTVTVTCVQTTTTEGNRNVAAYQLVATACNQPPCPNPAPASGYVERQVQATLSKCKDPTAAGPRFACG